MKHLLLTLVTSLLTAGAWAAATPCANRTPGLQTFYSNGWGVDGGNQRYQPDTSIGAANARDLQLRWSYGFSTGSPRVHPLVSEDTIFIGDGGHGLVALGRADGCLRWENTDIADVGSAIAHGETGGRTILVVAGRRTGIYAVDAESGNTLWHRPIDHDNPVPGYSGTPVVFEDRVFVPLSSMEIGLSANPFYGCCTTSGAVAALELATGDLLWYQRTIREAPQVTGRHYLFVEERGPSGAPVWGTVTLDEERRRIYFGTGQNYSRPATDTSDAIIALDTDTGDIIWVTQATEDDAFNMACTASREHPNCPKPMGPDVDFGAPPVLTRLADGSDVVLAGQKSGDVWALDPDDGRVLWKRRIGRGGALGGVHWGMAVDPTRQILFVPVSDVPAIAGSDEPEPGLFALDAASGTPRWSAPRAPRCTEGDCWSGLSAAIVAGPGIVAAGGLDGLLEVYDSTTGQILWQFDSLIDFATVNGVAAHGGSFDAHGPQLAGNQLIAVSGYGSFRQKAGNALLVFEPSTTEQQGDSP